MPRTGDEPSHARSPLRLRLALVLVGLVGAVVVAAWWASSGRTTAAVVAGAVAAVALVNLVVVLVRLRSGPHYQPGDDVRPYRPAQPAPRARPAPPGVPSAARRQRVYLGMMIGCLTLITVAWVGVRWISLTAALVMSAVAAVIPPVAAIMANSGWSERDGRPPDDADGA